MNTNSCTPFISLRLNGQTNCARSVDAFVAVAEIDEGAGLGVSFNVLTSCKMVSSALEASRIVDGIVNEPSAILYAHKFSLRPQTKSYQANTPTTRLYYIASQVHTKQWVPATVSWKVHSKTIWHGSDSPCLLVLPILFYSQLCFCENSAREYLCFGLHKVPTVWNASSIITHVVHVVVESQEAMRSFMCVEDDIIVMMSHRLHNNN